MMTLIDALNVISSPRTRRQRSRKNAYAALERIRRSRQQTAWVGDQLLKPRTLLAAVRELSKAIRPVDFA